MPRIRTIKPDFWSHPILSKQDDPTRLMAIALLNYADDEGYFYAEPNLVRGFCRPFDDNSTITRRCLDNLSKIGYISICKNENYGSIGRIEKFLAHQKIDRATDSKLKQYYSTNPRRTLDEPSTPERKGKDIIYNAFYDDQIELSIKKNIQYYPEFVKWLFENNINKQPLKKVLAMNNQITCDNFKNYVEKYGSERLKSTILDLENYTKKTYSSFNLTINKWLKK